MASEARDVEVNGPGGGAVAGMPAGLAAPGGDPSTPSGDTAGPAPSPTPAREYAAVRWVMPFWHRPVGHVETLELTELVRAVILSGKLELVDAHTHAEAPAEPVDGEDGTARRPRRRG